MPTRLQIARESWRRLGEFMPAMRRTWLAMLVYVGLNVAAAVTLALGAVIARRVPHGAIVVQSALLSWAAGWFYVGFWRHRLAYRQRYAAQAYRHLCVRFLMPALVAGAAAACLPILVSGERLLPPALALGLAAYLLLTVCLLESRGREIFWSWDVRSFVYSVFPERAQVMTSGVFAWLRHPLYSAGVRWVFALALLRNNAPALICAAMIAVAFRCMGFLEERELAEHDSQYATYWRRIPAVFSPHPLRFWRFLLTGKNDP